MIKSAHPDVALWSYERPSRGYFGYHLRARTQAAREKLCQKLVGLGPSEPIVLRFGAQLEDVVATGWVRSEYGFLTLVRGESIAEGEGLNIAVPNESWSPLLSMLAQTEVKDEGSVNVITPNGHVPLWVWWDAE